MPWFIESDQLLWVFELRDPTDGEYVNTATVRATMYDTAGSAISGQTWPLTLDYQTGPITWEGVTYEDGNYLGTLEDGRVMTEGAMYRAVITADAGGDLIKTLEKWDVARYKQFQEA